MCELSPAAPSSVMAVLSLLGGQHIQITSAGTSGTLLSFPVMFEGSQHSLLCVLYVHVTPLCILLLCILKYYYYVY